MPASGNGSATVLLNNNATPNNSFAANGFSKLSAYGLVNGQYRWLIENDAGVPVINYVDQYQINGQPVAGDWNPTGTAPAGQDEVGLFTGTNWDLFTGGLYGDGLGGALTQVPVWQPGYPIVGDFDGSGHVSLATYNINTETFYFQLWNPQQPGKWNIHVAIPLGGDGIQLGVNTRPVAADMDEDGITDIGLYTPVSTGGTSNSPSDWYFLLSNAPPGTTPTAGGNVNYLNHPFSPTTLGGHDLFAQMGNNYAVPVIGHFDPPTGGPVTPAPAPTTLTVNLVGTPGNDTFAFQKGSAPNTWTVTLNGKVQTYTSPSIIVDFNGAGGKDKATVNGSGPNQTAVLSPGQGVISGPGYSLYLQAKSITVNADGGSGQATFYGETTKGNVFAASPTSATMCDTSTAFWTDYDNTAVGFQQVTANATPNSKDQAAITDGGIASVLTASGKTTTLSNSSAKATDYVLSLFNFGGVTATLSNKASVKNIGPTAFKLTVQT